MTWFLKHLNHHFLPSPCSGWFQVSEGSDTVSVMFRAKGNELIRGGEVMAKHGCWTLLKGGITANFSSTVEILFEVKHIFHKFLTNKNILKNILCLCFHLVLFCLFPQNSTQLQSYRAYVLLRLHLHVDKLLYFIEPTNNFYFIV